MWKCAWLTICVIIQSIFLLSLNRLLTSLNMMAVTTESYLQMKGNREMVWVYKFLVWWVSSLLVIDYFSEMDSSGQWVCVKLFCLCLHGDSPDESRGQLGGQVVENQYVCCHGLSCWTMTFFQTSPWNFISFCCSGIVLVFTFSCSGNFKPGVYAVTVTGRLPPGMSRSKAVNCIFSILDQGSKVLPFWSHMLLDTRHNQMYVDTYSSNIPKSWALTWSWFPPLLL